MAFSPKAGWRGLRIEGSNDGRTLVPAAGKMIKDVFL